VINDLFGGEILKTELEEGCIFIMKSMENDMILQKANFLVLLNTWMFF